jgi:hypothetical protein
MNSQRLQARAVELALAAVPQNLANGPDSVIGQLIRAIVSGVTEAIAEELQLNKQEAE